MCSNNSRKMVRWRWQRRQKRYAAFQLMRLSTKQVCNFCCWKNAKCTDFHSRRVSCTFCFLTEIGCFNYLLLFISGMIQFAYLVEASVISYIMPVSQCDITMNARERGILGGACFLGTICSSHLWGFLADTKGRRRIILPTLFTSFVLAVCASFASNVYTLATFRFLTGFL